MKEKNYEKLYLFVKEEFKDFFESEMSNRCSFDIKTIIQYLDNCKQLKDYKLKKFIEDDPWSPIYYNIKDNVTILPMLGKNNVKLTNPLSGLYIADFLTMLFLNYGELTIGEQVTMSKISSELGYIVNPNYVISFKEINGWNAEFRMTLDFTPMQDRLANIFIYFITYLYNKIDYRYTSPTLIKDLDLNIINPRKKLTNRKVIVNRLPYVLEEFYIYKTVNNDHETIIKVSDPYQSFILSFLMEKYNFQEVFKEA